MSAAACAIFSPSVKLAMYLSRMKKADLQALARSKQLDEAGTKDELKARIMAAIPSDDLAKIQSGNKDEAEEDFDDALQDFVSKAGGAGGGSGHRGGAASTIDDDLELMRKKVELMELRKREAQLLEEMPKRPGDVPATFADLLTCLHATPDRLKTNALLIPDFADKKMGKKPTLETVSVGQWVMGNARIMLAAAR